MEVIKRTIKQVLKTGVTVPCSYRDPETGILITGCTAMTKTIVPDTGATYCFKIQLSQDSEDIGFFDAYVLDMPFDYIEVGNNLSEFKRVVKGEISLASSGLPIVYDNGSISGTTITSTTFMVTGQSMSRLTELRKYAVSGSTSTTADLYKTGGSLLVDGVDLSQTNVNKFVYFLGGIRYVDILTGLTSGTTFSFVGQGLSGPDFINKPIYKNPNKENIISNPKIYDDVFIVRQEISAFDKNYRLEYIGNLIDLETYAGGKFFNIVNNT